MKRHILGAIVLVAALAFAGCNNNQKNDQKEMKRSQKMKW